MDPFGHPDLQRLGRSLRSRLDETLDADQSAAHSAARRRRTLRDVCLDAEDRGAHIVVSTTNGHIWRGRIDAVGVDHVLLVDGDVERTIAIPHIVMVEAT